MSNLYNFVNTWQAEYDLAIQDLLLFQPEFAKSWNLEQKQHFIKYFYHARGHFYKFLFYMGITAPTIAYKEVIVNNISEEFGEESISHEQMYFNFAKHFGVDLKLEVLEEKYYFDFIKEFNQGHLNWLNNHDYNHKWSAFAAYEKLDNMDYTLLYQLAQNIGANTNESLLFFKVHNKATHFESTSPLLEQIWQKDEIAVKAGFEFIARHQLAMWKELGEVLA